MVIVEGHVIFDVVPVPEWNTLVKSTLYRLDNRRIQCVVVTVEVVEDLGILGNNQQNHLVAHTGRPNRERGNCGQKFLYLLDKNLKNFFSS